jgi:uncharacterized membrane protein
MNSITNKENCLYNSVSKSIRILLFSSIAIISIGFSILLFNMQKNLLSTITMDELYREIFQVNPNSIITIGIIILIITPIISVVIASIQFIKNNEKLFIIVTMLLLFIFGLSIAIALL